MRFVARGKCKTDPWRWVIRGFIDTEMVKIVREVGLAGRTRRRCKMTELDNYGNTVIQFIRFEKDMEEDGTDHKK